MKRFIFRLTIFAVIVGVIFFGLGFAIGYPATLNFILAVGIIIANVPEGLII
jgi:sodium/potassium-transporting ATPase subunit alpha